MKQLFLLSFFVTLFACVGKPKQPLQQTKEQIVLQHLDSLKRVAKTGDLIVRSGDDLLSYQIKFLNDADKTYSHAGMIVEQSGQKMVAHITPDDSTAEGVHYIPIDSFLAPAKNLSCALYRYSMPGFNGDSVAAAIERYRLGGVRFDRVYDLNTDSLMYCSEMISKALLQGTRGIIQIKEAKVPESMQKTVYLYFQKKLSPRTIAERNIITIDNLYRNPACQLVMSFPLKYFPGQ